MKTLRIRDRLTIADPLQSERVLKALTIILKHQEAPDASSLSLFCHSWHCSGTILPETYPSECRSGQP